MDSGNNRNRDFRFCMAVSFRNNLSPNDSEPIIEEILKISDLHSNEVTPRSRLALEDAVRNNNLYLAFSDRELIGWALAEPLTNKVTELGMAYVKPAFRNDRVLHRLLGEVARRPERIIIATYSQNLLNYAKDTWNCDELTLFQVALVTRGRFITKRLNAETRKHVNAHMKAGKPKFAITRGNSIE